MHVIIEHSRDLLSLVDYTSSAARTAVAAGPW
jgi:hypothetical protein